MNNYENTEKENKLNKIEEEALPDKVKKGNMIVKNLDKMLFSQNNLSKYSWENDGERVNS